MKHTKENCNTCGVELTDTNWNISWKKTNRTQCQDCNNPNRTRHNPDRMFVNSKYVPKSHPLHKAGRFKTFEGAAFSSLKGYEKTTEGHVYIISNPCWEGWIKVGMAVDAEDRCNQYQTSSPFRDYKLCHAKYFEDRKSAEHLVHKKLKRLSTKHKGEWFKVSVDEATKLIEAI